MQLFSVIITSGITAACVINAQAVKIKDPYAPLECPKLSLDQAVQIVKSGKIIDSIPHFVAFAQPVHQPADVAQATTLSAYKPYEDSDGNVICKYALKDLHNNILFDVALSPDYGINEEPSER